MASRKYQKLGYGKELIDYRIRSIYQNLSNKKICLATTQDIAPLTENGFYIDKLVEPKPTQEFEKLDKKHYKELNEFPAFMCIRAVKKAELYCGKN